MRPTGLPGDFLEIALTDADGAAYLWEETSSRSTLAAGWHAGRQRWTVGRRADGALRIHAVFRRTAPLDPSTPILDSPALEDITLVYAPPGGEMLTAWEGD